MKTTEKHFSGSYKDFDIKQVGSVVTAFVFCLFFFLQHKIRRPITDCQVFSVNEIVHRHACVVKIITVTHITNVDYNIYFLVHPTDHKIISG